MFRNPLYRAAGKYILFYLLTIALCRVTNDFFALAIVLIVVSCVATVPTGYTGILTTDAQLSVQNNPVRTVANVSGKALKVTSTADGTRSGLTALLTKGAFDTDPVAYYPSGYRNGTKAFSVKMLYANPSDKSKYFPRAQCKSTQEVFGLPDRINGEAFDGTAAEWDRLVKAGDWNVLQWTCNTSDVYRIDLKPFLDFAGSNAASDSERVIYFDDFRLLK